MSSGLDVEEREVRREEGLKSCGWDLMLRRQSHTLREWEKTWAGKLEHKFGVHSGKKD